MGSRGYHVVLSNDVGSALGEVEGDAGLVAAKVVGMEDELPADERDLSH